MLLPSHCSLQVIYNPVFVSGEWLSFTLGLAIFALDGSIDLQIFPSEYLDMLAEKLAEDIKNHK